MVAREQLADLGVGLFGALGQPPLDALDKEIQDPDGLAGRSIAILGSLVHRDRASAQRGLGVAGRGAVEIHGVTLQGAALLGHRDPDEPVAVIFETDLDRGSGGHRGQGDEEGADVDVVAGVAGLALIDGHLDHLLFVDGGVELLDEASREARVLADDGHEGQGMVVHCTLRRAVLVEEAARANH